MRRKENKNIVIACMEVDCSFVLKFICLKVVLLSNFASVAKDFVGKGKFISSLLMFHLLTNVLFCSNFLFVPENICYKDSVINAASEVGDLPVVSRRWFASGLEEEDEQLCRSWLVTSKDPIRGTDQHRTEFWKTVKLHAESEMQSFTALPYDGLGQRFGTISYQVSKFIGHLSFVGRLNRSGATTEDYDETKKRYSQKGLGNWRK